MVGGEGGREGGGREGNTLSSELTKTNSVLKQKTTDSHCVKCLYIYFLSVAESEV